MAQRILLVGGTGLLGEAVAQGLQKAGYAVRVMSRHAGGARAKFAAPFEIVEGDALERADLEGALIGCDAVHISIDHEREDECVARVVEAASAHGVNRITYVSGTTVCEANRWFPLVDRKLKAEQAICASGIEHTIFCPGWFMEMLAHFVHDGRVTVFGRPVRRWHFLPVQEFARMVVESYRRREATGKRFHLHGPEAFTVAEALQRYCRVLYPEIGRIRGTPYWLLRLVARFGGNAELRAGLEMVSYLEKVGEEGDPAEANAILGAPQVTLEQWLQMQKETVQ